MTDVLRSIRSFLPRQRSRRPAKPLDILLAAEAMTPLYETALRLPANRRCVCWMPCLMETRLSGQLSVQIAPAPQATDG